MSKLVTYGQAPALLRSRPRRWFDGLRSYWQTMPSLRDPHLAKLLGRPVPSESGNIVVTWENAFTFSAVFDAVNQLSNDIAKLPLNLHKRLPNGGSEPYYDSPVFDLLKTEPNPEMDTMMLRRTMQAHALTWHGGFAEIERNGLGRPVAIWPLTPDRVTVKRNGRDQLYYEVANASGQPTALDPKDTIHIVGLGFTPHCGYTTIHLARKAIGLALAAEQFGASFFENGSNFGGILEAPQVSNKEQAKELQDTIASRHQGVRRAWEIMVAWGGIKFTPNGVEPSKAQMNELRSKQVEEVARFFNMPVHKLKNLDRATNNNIEQQDLEYYKGPILNWITGWELELGRKLIPRLERRQQFFKHNANAFLRGDFQSRSTSLGMMRDKGVINADDWREFEDMNPQEGGQGKLYLVQSAQTPLNLIAELVQSQIDKNAAPPPAPPAPAPPAADDPERSALEARVQRAETAAETAVADAQAQREARIAAEASRDATQQDVEACRQRERDTQALATQLTAMAESLKAELSVAVQQRAEAQAAELAETRRHADVQHDADAAAQTLATEVTARQLAEARAIAAEQELEVLGRRLSEADQAVTAATTERDRAVSAVAEATTARASAESALTEATAAGARVTELAAELERATTAERDAITARETAVRQAEEATAVAHRAMAAASSAEQQASEQQVARVTAETRATDALVAATTANQALAAVKAQALDGTEALIASHRSLFEHTMRLMVERETERARRSQQTPDKLRAWLTTWYDSHRSLMVAALTPAVRVHLAFMRSTESTAAVVAHMVDAHITESRRQLEAVVDGSAGALAPSLAQLLLRWESERPSAFADTLFQEEMTYVRRNAA